jgi:hypothetical protein
MEEFIVLLVVYSSILLYDWSILTKSKLRREKFLYFVMMLFSLYIGVDYLTNTDLFGFYDLFDHIFLDISKMIDKWLQIPE